MTAESFGRPIHLTKLPWGGVAISVDTDCERAPVLVFSSWESFTEFASTEFASAVQDFYNEMKLDVPDVYKQAFHNHENL